MVIADRVEVVPSLVENRAPDVLESNPRDGGSNGRSYAQTAAGGAIVALIEIDRALHSDCVEMRLLVKSKSVPSDSSAECSRAILVTHIC